MFRTWWKMGWVRFKSVWNGHLTSHCVFVLSVYNIHKHLCYQSSQEHCNDMFHEWNALECCTHIATM